jgi:iron-sulfur cluster repair protein YtfE (RIC family)
LLPHIDALLAAADSVGVDSPEVVRTKARAALDCLSGHLIPHAMAEDAALYPVVQKAMGAPRATATMSRDHVEVGKLTAELATAMASMKSDPLAAETARELRRTLHGLHALVRVHFAKEEEIYLPLLDATLSPAEAKAMFEAMGAAAARAKQ